MSAAIEQFDQIYTELFPRVHAYFSLCFGEHIADECTQQVFLKVWRQLSCTAWRAPDSIRAWVFRIAVNVKNDYWRTARACPTAVPLEEALDAPACGQEEAVLHTLSVVQALEALTARDRDILLLHAGGLTGAEIGRVLGKSDSTVRSQLADARRRFRKLLEEQGVSVDE